MTTELLIKISDPIGMDVGRAYLSWLKANSRTQTPDNLQAFVAGWALASQANGDANTISIFPEGQGPEFTQAMCQRSP